MKEVNPKKKLFLVYRPNTGKQLKLETCADLKKKYKKVTIKMMLVSNLKKSFLFFSDVCIQLRQIKAMDCFSIAQPVSEVLQVWLHAFSIAISKAF